MTDHPAAGYRQVRFQKPAGACEILLVRHGESMPVRAGVPIPTVDGHDDPDLDPVGVAQAERAAARLVVEPLTAIYVTTLRRTHQTAAPLVAKLGIEPRVERDLREVHLGEWEGGIFRVNVAEGHPLYREMLAKGRWDVLPGAEPAEQFAARVRAGIQRIAAAHPDETVAVFSHGGTIAEAVRQACDAPQPFAFLPDNASISHLVVERDRWVLRRFNDTAHLGAGFTIDPEPLI